MIFQGFQWCISHQQPFPGVFSIDIGKLGAVLFGLSLVTRGPLFQAGDDSDDLAEGCNSGISWGQWMSIFMELLDPKSNGSNGGCILPMDPMDAQMLISIES